MNNIWIFVDKQVFTDKYHVLMDQAALHMQLPVYEYYRGRDVYWTMAAIW